jgi:hypothetical protein
MSTKWRRFEVMLPRQFNDGRDVPPERNSLAVLEIGAHSFQKYSTFKSFRPRGHRLPIWPKVAKSAMALFDQTQDRCPARTGRARPPRGSVCRHDGLSHRRLRPRRRGDSGCVDRVSAFHLLGYGFCQKLSPLQLKGGRVSMVTSPLTWHWQDRRISSS